MPHVLQQHELEVNKKKCSFRQFSLGYLGHIVVAEGVAADPKKLEAMWLWPIPKDVRGLRRVLGLTGYYCMFINR